MARDIDNVREGEARSGSPLAENVLYTDALFARVRGKVNLRAFAPLAATVTKPRAAVTSMVCAGAAPAAAAARPRADSGGAASAHGCP